MLLITSLPGQWTNLNNKTNVTISKYIYSLNYLYTSLTLPQRSLIFFSCNFNQDGIPLGMYWAFGYFNGGGGVLNGFSVLSFRNKYSLLICLGSLYLSMYRLKGFRSGNHSWGLIYGSGKSYSYTEKKIK